MISFFRKNRKSLVGVFIVGLCILLMLPFGAEYFSGSSVMKPYVVKVEGQEISYRAFSDEVRRAESMYRSQFGEQYEIIAKMLNIKERVLDDIIDRTLLSQLYSRVGLVASFAQVEKYAMSLPMFQNGVDRAAFESFLRSAGLKEHEFETKVREQVIEDMLGDTLSLAAVTNPAELEQRYKRANANIKINYMEVTPPAEVNAEPPTDEELLEYYSKNRSRFFSEKMIEPVILRFPASAFFKQVLVHEEDIEDLFKRTYQNSDKSITEVRSQLEKELKESIAPEYAKVAAEEVISKIIQSAEDKRFETIQKLASESTSLELKVSESPMGFSALGSTISQSVSGDVFQMKKGGVRLFFDGNTPVVVFINEVVEPEQLEFDSVKADILTTLLRSRENDRKRYFATELVSQLRKTPPDQLASGVKDLAAKNKFKINSTEETSIQKVVLPFVSNPQDIFGIVSDLLTNGVYGSPYVALDGTAYIISLDSYSTPDTVSEKELGEFLLQEKNIIRGRAFQTILTKLKSISKIEVAQYTYDYLN